MKKATRNFRTLLVVIIVAAFLIAGVVLSAGKANAQEAGPIQSIETEFVNPFYSVMHLTLNDGTQLLGSFINGPSSNPEGKAAEQETVVDPDSENAKILPNVPAFNWVLGCSAVSASMIAGYYDRTGYSNIYTGPTNGGVYPMVEASSWGHWSDGSDTYPNNPLIASKQNVDGRTTRGSINDYWVKYGSTAKDPYISHWSQHTWGTSVGDFMKTSQSAYASTDGSTWFWNFNDATKLTCATMEKFPSGIGTYTIAQADGTYGRKLFYQARGYTVTDCYSQNTDNNATGGFSLANFKAQIDAGHPVFLNLEGHSIVGLGYDPASSKIYVHDTWDNNTHTMTWGTSYAGLRLLSVSIVNLASPTIPLTISPIGNYSNTTVTYYWARLPGATQYSFEAWNSAGTNKLYAPTVPASACGTLTCSKTVAIVIPYGNYKWHVRAFIGGAWKSYGSYASFTVSNIPSIIEPSGYIGDTTPKYIWTAVTGATEYSFTLYKGSSTVYSKTVASSACTAGACSMTPTTVLGNGTYKWKVRAHMLTGWGAYSPLRTFILDN